MSEVDMPADRSAFDRAPFWSSVTWPRPSVVALDIEALRRVALRFPELSRRAETGCDLAFSLIGAGSNSINYLVEASDGSRYVLKANHLRASSAVIDEIAAWSAQIPVGWLRIKQTVTADNGRFAVCTDDKSCPWELSRFMDGTRYGGSLEQAAQIGRALGELHKHFAGHGGPSAEPAHYWDDDERLCFSADLQDGIKESAPSAESAVSLIQAVRCGYDLMANTNASMPPGWVHGDLHLDNILPARQGDGVFVFDFDFTRLVRGGHRLDLGCILHRCLRTVRIAGSNAGTLRHVTRELTTNFVHSSGLTVDPTDSIGLAIRESLIKIQACTRLMRNTADSGWSMLALNHAMYVGEMLELLSSGALRYDD